MSRSLVEARLGGHSKGCLGEGGDSRETKIREAGSRRCSIRDQDVGLSTQVKISTSVGVMKDVTQAVQTYTFHALVNNPATVEVL